MSKKELEKSKQDFCESYLASLDVCRAAVESGAENGYALLKEKDVQRCLEQHRKLLRKSVRTEDVIRRLGEIAFSKPNDAMALACGQQSARVEDLDLLAVSEFKYKDGQVEVKFMDRVRALQALGELVAEKEDGVGAAADFFRALEEHAAGDAAGDAL